MSSFVRNTSVVAERSPAGPASEKAHPQLPSSKWFSDAERVVFVGLMAVMLTGCGAPAPSNSAEAPAAAEASAEELALPDPAPVIETIYAPYIAGRMPSESDAFPPFSASLQALSDRAHNAHEADMANVGMPLFDFDPYVMGQDFEVRSVTASVERPPANGRTVVTARFRNMGRDTTVTYDLVFENAAWHIDNMRSGDFDMRAFLNAAL